jgi:hypothetical protein
MGLQAEQKRPFSVTKEGTCHYPLAG